MTQLVLKLAVIMFFAFCVAVATQTLWLPAELLHLSENVKAVITLGLAVSLSISATAIMVWERL